MSTKYANEENETCHMEHFYESQPVAIKTVKIVLISIVFVLSLAGNALIIIIVYKRKELRKTVNFFIVNMAVSSLVLPLIHIPLFVASELISSFQWLVPGLAGLILCKLQLFLVDVSTTVSVQSLLWIAVDQFMAVVFPMKINIISPRFRPLAIISTWIVAIILTSKDLYTAKVLDYFGVLVCREDTSNLVYKVFTYVRIIGFWIVPLIVKTILYSAIVLTLVKRDKVVGQVRLNKKNTRNHQAIRMSLCMIVSFYVCPLSPEIILILKVSGKWELLSQNPKSCSFLNDHFAWFFVYFGLFLSTTINPIICLTFVESYRRRMRELLICHKTPSLKGREKRKCKTGHVEQMTLQRIRVLPDNKSNLSAKCERETNM